MFQRNLKTPKVFDWIFSQCGRVTPFLNCARLQEVSWDRRGKSFFFLSFFSFFLHDAKTPWTHIRIMIYTKLFFFQTTPSVKCLRFFFLPLKLSSLNYDSCFLFLVTFAVCHVGKIYIFPFFNVFVEYQFAVH